MKNIFFLLALLATFTACSDQADPAPEAGNVTLNLISSSNSTSFMVMPASACLRTSPMRTPGSGQVLWQDKITSTQVKMAPITPGTRLYLSIQYDNVNRPNYVWPAPGEYIQAEVLLNGKRITTVALNAESFARADNYFSPDGTGMHLMQEVEVNF